MEQVFQTDIKSAKRASNISGLLKTYFSFQEVTLVDSAKGAKYIIKADQKLNKKIISLLREFGYKCELILRSSQG